MTKYVYLFKEGNANMRELLGGKGANLAEMTNLGLPVPQGFTVTTEACTRYYTDGKKIDDEIVEQIYAALAETEKIAGKKFGDEENPFLVSVRSGARASMPSAMQGKISFAPGKKFSFFSRRMVFFPVRKRSTHTQETPCDRTVATAAPRMPIPSPKISTGSSTIFSTAPMSTVCIPTVAKPCAVIKAFIPSVSWTNRVPRA